MLLAIRVPKRQGKKGTSLETKEVSEGRISHARTVIEHAQELVELVINGSMGLDAALAEATRRKQVGPRYLAACQAGRDCPTRVHEGDPLAFVISANLHRRHLTTSQRAAVAAELANMGEGRPKKTGSNDPVSQPAPVSIEQAAAALNVSPKSVKRAKKTMREDPEAHQAAKAGKPMKTTKAKPRAERQAGVLLRELAEREERATRKNGVDHGANKHLSKPATSAKPSPPQTLRDMGVSRDESSKWQALASIPESPLCRVGDIHAVFIRPAAIPRRSRPRESLQHGMRKALIPQV